MNVKTKWYLENKDRLSIVHKQYYQDNKEKFKVYHTQYYQDNRERFTEKRDCQCGGRYTIATKTVHCKSAKHHKYICKIIYDVTNKFKKKEKIKCNNVTMFQEYI